MLLFCIVTWAVIFHYNVTLNWINLAVKKYQGPSKLSRPFEIIVGLKRTGRRCIKLAEAVKIQLNYYPFVVFVFHIVDSNSTIYLKCFQVDGG